ncbi:SEL1-like repeat protein [Qipengyuania atrilutea]|uniref:SEL1-like repeat protein n=1 Tax=Qipengyuania atrilutea TaxID=2744473 RepID=UPI001CEC74D8|nr:SEL1-like repeat protein [Actirhodobacter atriluteus]
MGLREIEGGAVLGLNHGSLTAITDGIARFRNGDEDALYNLGVAFSTGSGGAACDMIEAHKWLNIAAAKGHEDAAQCRADIAEEMTAREIAEAQRQAREWLSQDRRQAA